MQNLSWPSLIVSEGGGLGVEMNERIMKFSSLKPISKWEIVGYMVHMKVMKVYEVWRKCWVRSFRKCVSTEEYK